MPTETTQVTLNQSPESKMTVGEALRAVTENTRQPDPALPDEQVWLHMFCAALVRPERNDLDSAARYCADNGLKEFRQRFR